MPQPNIYVTHPSAIFIRDEVENECGDVYRCPVCGWESGHMHWDIVGADPGCQFCTQCHTECSI